MSESFYLCGKPGKCCPKVEIDTHTKLVAITDDYGGEVQMTIDEFKQLRDHDLQSVQE